MFTTEEVEVDNKVYRKDILLCDTCGLEIERGQPAVFLKISCSMTQVTKEYHKYCAPGEIIRILADG